MKIRFRIGAGQNDDEDGPQPPERYCSARSTIRFLDPARFTGSPFWRPFTPLALMRKGRVSEAGRFCGASRLRALPVAPMPLLPPHPVLKSGTKLGESEQLSDISIRHKPKYRSDRKQTIKPCLTGARTSNSDSRFSRDFPSLYLAYPDEGKELSRRGMPSRNPLFESRMLQQDARFSSSSNRFWLKNRSYRKQMIKPCLTGSRLAHFASRKVQRDAQCVTRFLHDSRAPFVPAVAGATRASAILLEDVRHTGRVLSLPGRHPRMGYIDRIQSDLTAAMKQKDELRLSVLRMMKSALKHKEIEKVRPLDDLESLQVLQTLVKQRHESVEQFTKGGRNDLAEKEAKEIKIIETYLPAAPSDEEVHRAVEAAIAEAGADSLKQMGAVIKAARARLEGKSVDGKALSDRVRDRLTEKSAGKP